MTKIRQILLLILLVLLVIVSAVFTACGKAAYTITLDKASLELEVSSEYTLIATGEYEGDIVWTSSNNEVVTVTNGKVSAVGVGEAVVKATVGENELKAEASCNVIVIETITIAWTTDDITEEGGEYKVAVNPLKVTTKQLSVSVSKAGTVINDAIVSWTSSDQNIVSVSDGLLTVKMLGDAVITAKYHSAWTNKDYEKSVTVSVKVDDTTSFNDIGVLDESFAIGEDVISVAYDSQSLAKVFDSEDGFWTAKGSYDVYAISGEKIYAGRVVVADKLITNEADFTAFLGETRSATTAIYTDKIVALTADLDMTAYANWEDLNQDATKGFAGTFDGLNHVIYGGRYDQSGMFAGITATGAVKNFTVIAPTIKNGYSGVITSALAGTIDNVDIVFNGIVSTNNTTLTEACLYAYKAFAGSTIKNCDIVAPNTNGTWFVKVGTYQYSNNNVYTTNGWINSINPGGHTGNSVANVVIDGETEITTTASDGAKVYLVTANGIKIDSGNTVLGGATDHPEIRS